ncbi:YkgJ family cysteine cluster protein [bacterium]|nr:YkgJ family cysteine cluster protein [bacterium]
MKLLYPAQRYQCIQCGKSCGEWRIWVEPELIPRLRQHPLALRLEVAGHPYLSRDEESGWSFLEYDSQRRCLFLQDEHLCGLHASSGWLSKPRACRQFPFFLVETPEGVQVGLSFRCSAVQQDLGVDWAEHQADLNQLIESGCYLRIGFEPAQFGLDSLPWSDYQDWERSWRLSLSERSLEQIFYRHLNPILPAPEFTRLLQGWTLSACQLLQIQLPAAQPQVHPHSRRYFEHVLERKYLWLGGDLLGRMALMLVGERLLWGALGAGRSWSEAFDLVEGQWLGHREDLGPIQAGLAQTLLQFQR